MKYIVKCMKLHYWEEGQRKWKDPGLKRWEFDTEYEAWKFAQERSTGVPNGSTYCVYQVFKNVGTYDKSTRHGHPYIKGMHNPYFWDNEPEPDGGPKPGKEPVFVLQYRTGNGPWKWFDSKGSKEYLLRDLPERLRGCSFGTSRTYQIRITEQSDPVRVVFQGKPTQKELEAWADSYVSTRDHENPFATQGQESEMQINKPLNVPRTTIIEKIQAYLDKRQAEHDERVAKAKERNATRFDVFDRLYAAEPERVINNCGQTLSLVTDVVEGDKTYEQALEHLQSWAEYASVGAKPSEEASEKMLSVLTAATDETIEVTTDSDLYRYL